MEFFTNILFCVSIVLIKFASGQRCSRTDSLSNINFINCTILPVSNITNKSITDFLNKDEMTLLKLNFQFPEVTQNAINMHHLENDKKKHNASASYFYEPFHWKLLVSHISDKLLTLKPNFEVLSLNTLNVGIRDLETKMIDTPLGCLANVTYYQYIFIIKEYLLQFESGVPNSHDILVCTEAMQDLNGEALFNPVCYGIKKKSGSRFCNYLESGTWSRGLNIFINIIKFVAILFSPMLIPNSLYNSKYMDNAYRVELQSKIPIKVMVSDQKLNENDKKWKFSLPMSYFKQWKSFRPDNMDTGVVYNLELASVNLGIKSNILVSKSHIPAGLIDLIYERFYLCNIGHDLSFRWCCYSSICPKHMQCKKCSTNSCISWLKCCQMFMKVILICLIPQPWIIRLIIYYYYEKHDFDIRRISAYEQGLSMTFKGYLLGYISPIHWFFIAMYILYAIDMLIMGTLVKGVLRELFKIIRESFRDMNSSLSFEVIRWGISRYLVPFSYFGLLGIFVAPVYWLFVTPVILIVFSFYYIPLVSVFFRLILHLFWFCLPDCATESKCYKKIRRYAEKTHLISRHLKVHTLSPHRKIVKTERRAENCAHRHFQIIIVVLCLLTLAAITVLVTECIGYLIDIFAFTLIGLILHTNTVLPYISFVFMIIFYLSTSVKDVRLTYMGFNKTIITTVSKAAEKDLKLGNHWADTAYFIKPDDSISPFSELTFSKSGNIYFRASSLILFINKEDHAFIPRDFFYKTCEMPVPTCPGPRSMRYFKAFVKFFFVLLFLIFVMVVVLSFGGLYNISSTHQMFVALAGGVIPWVFRNVLQLNPAPLEVNTQTLSFRKHFWSEIKNFKTDYKIRDFEVQLLSHEDSVRNNAATRVSESASETVVEIATRENNEDRINSNLYVYFDGPFLIEI